MKIKFDNGSEINTIDVKEPTRSKLQTNIQEFRLNCGYKDVIVLCNKLTHDSLYEELDCVRYVTKECFGDGVYYLAKDESIEESIELDTHFDASCVRGGVSNTSPSFNPRNYRTDIDKIMQNIKIVIDNNQHL